MGSWAVIDIALLASGIVSLVLSIVWRAPNVLMNMVLSNADLTAGTILGIAFLITFVVSVAAIVQRNHVTFPLVILNYCLVVDGIGTVVVGTFVWFYTLRERANFYEMWKLATRDERILLQDQFKCCGYFNGTDVAEIGGTFCTSAEVIAALPVDELESSFCVKYVTEFADNTLNNVFTTTYGFMAVILCLLLATLCVIKKRDEEERFKRIDAKRGGRGFV